MTVKNYLNINVYEATQKRLKFIFDEFSNILVAFSGGKDSGLMLNLTLEYAKSINQLDKVAVYFLDYEAQYKQTIDYVTNTFNKLPKQVKKYWVCLPMKVPCTTSMFQNFWVPWEEKSKKIWVRPQPKKSYVINIDNAEFDYDDWDYTVQDNFCTWFSKNNENSCVLVGIRATESLNRQAAITSKQKINKFKNKEYITKKEGSIAVYPIYDWNVSDIWVANCKFNYSYNSLYDLFYKAGLSIDQMRVASPFLGEGKATLALYKAIDPETWGKMLNRVNGVNFTAIYGSTKILGWKNITKPDHFSWKQYMYFLLDTLPKKTRDLYLKKLKVSKKSWRVGAARDQKTINELLAEHAPVILTGKISNRGKKDKQIIQFEDYIDDTNVTNFKEIPTYKRMCICILKNDTTCKYMGFAQTKAEIEKRQNAMKKYANLF